MNHILTPPTSSPVTLSLVALPAFDDNYIWMLHDGQRALVVDPGDAEVVLAALKRLSLRLETILVTHHHIDHTGGVDVLRDTTGAMVFGPMTETMPEPIRRLEEGDKVQAMGLTFDVIDVPGHTSGHIAFYAIALKTCHCCFVVTPCFQAAAVACLRVRQRKCWIH